jgi:hypothetical protein
MTNWQNTELQFHFPTRVDQSNWFPDTVSNAVTRNWIWSKRSNIGSGWQERALLNFELMASKLIIRTVTRH